MTEMWVLGDCDNDFAIFATEEEARKAAEDYVSGRIDGGFFGWKVEAKSYDWTAKNELMVLHPSRGWVTTALSVTRWTIGKIPGWTVSAPRTS